MFKDYKVVAVTPAGRKRFLRILHRYMQQYTNIIDEWHLWKNTSVEEDQQYIDELHKSNPRFIKIIAGLSSDSDTYRINAVGNFYKYCIDLDTIYIKIDDDIVFIADDAFYRLLEYRIKHPQYFIIFACPRW